MWLLVGLGNPGAGYARNRHNVGFMAVEAIAEAYRFPPAAKKFGGVVTAGTIDGQKTLLLEPLSFMNNSGQPVAEVLHFYKIPPANLIVFHDELDLPPGKLRVKKGGGNGGHNGLRSIDAHIGPEYFRVRLGIGHPGDKDLVTPYVLGNFSKAEAIDVKTWLQSVAEHIPLLLSGDEAGFMNRISLATKEI